MTDRNWLEVHYSTLNGMCLHVPVADREALFNHIVSWGMDERSDISISENRSPGASRVFFDIDGGSTDPVTNEVLMTITRAALVTVRKAMGNPDDPDAWCVVMSPSHPSTNKKGHHRVSLHIVFPELRVGCEMQSALVELLNGQLQKEPHLGALHGLQADDSRALRLPFTIKAARCDACRKAKRRRGGCPACTGGYVYDRRWFRVLTVLGSNGVLDGPRFDRLNDPMEVLRCASIRTDGQPASDHIVRARVVELLGSAPAATIKRCPLMQMNTDEGGGAKFRDLPIRCREVEVLGDFIRKHAGPWYADVTVAKACVSNSPKRRSAAFIVRVEGAGSRFCQNYGREHNSVSVYFVATCARGLRQRCGCKCETLDARADGMCKDYRGPPVLFGETELQVLFGVTEPMLFHAARSISSNTPPNVTPRPSPRIPPPSSPSAAPFYNWVAKGAFVSTAWLDTQKRRRAVRD